MIDVPVEIAMSEPLFVSSQLSVYNAMKKMINTGKNIVLFLMKRIIILELLLYPILLNILF
ncbi:protein of unknown function [Methanocaldococcus lauensis]|nr:protein of unknown function [Methanocaldococcus lauensis]